MKEINKKYLKNFIKSFKGLFLIILISFNSFAQSKKEQIDLLIAKNDSLISELNILKSKSESDYQTLSERLLNLENKLMLLDSVQYTLKIQANEINSLKNIEEPYVQIINQISLLDYKWVESIFYEPIFNDEGTQIGPTFEEFQNIYSSTLSYLDQKSQNSIPSFCSSTLKFLYEQGISSSEIDWNEFSETEKFSYCMLFPEDYSQSCAGTPIIPGQEYYITSTFPTYASGLFKGEGTYQWSPRQLSFLLNNREKVIDWIISESRNENRIGQNYKSTLSLLIAKESIPEIIDIALKDIRDNDYWSLLLNICSKVNSLGGLLIGNFISDDKMLILSQKNINAIIEISQLINEGN
jgi:hypothetical protein